MKKKWIMEIKIEANNDSKESEYLSAAYFAYRKRSDNLEKQDTLIIKINQIIKQYQDKFNSFGLKNIRLNQIQIDSISQGSLTVIVTGVLAVYSFISKYKAFNEGLFLISEHLQILFGETIQEDFLELYGERGQFWVNTNILFPDEYNISRRRVDTHNLPHELVEELRHFHGLRTDTHTNPIIFRERSNSWRTAFFWYLLVINLLLISSIGFLVWKAIKIYLKQ